MASALGAAAHGDDLDTVATRIKASLTGSTPTAATVNGYLSSLGADGRWSDVNYADTSQTNWSQQNHLQRLVGMAEAYANPSHSLYGSTSLRDGILRAYDAFVTLDPRSTNWWFNEINTPQLLGETMLLVQPQLSAAQITSGTAIVGRAYIPRSTNAGTNTGTNRMDRAYATILRGMVARDTALTGEAFGAIADTLVKTTDEGIQVDGSFHQHGPQLNSGSYGLTFANEAADLSAYAVGTAFAMPAGSASVFVDYLLDGQQWMLRGVTFDATAQGRSITRASSRNLGIGLISVIDKTKTLTTYREDELTAMRNRLSAARTSGTAAPSLALDGHKHFWRSDFTSHQRPGFSATVKISSTRTLEPETGNGEGLSVLHLADGVNLIQQRGDEYTGIQPIWDWRRLPGTTTEQAAYSLKPAIDWGVEGPTGFAGGVSDGRNGATALDYAERNVKARKSWFFFDDVQVALGAGIDAAAATSPVITTLNQAFQKGSVTWGTTSGSSGSLMSGTQSANDMAWVQHDGIGYVFPTPQSVTLRAAVQSGSWSAINTSQSGTLVTGSVFSLQVNHGTAPLDGSYSYVALPGASSSSAAAYAAAPAVRVLANTRTLQAARHDGLALTQAAFYTSGTLATGQGTTLSLREPSLVMLDESASATKLSVSNPYGLATTIHADVARSRSEGPGEFTRVTIRLSGSDQGGATVTRVLDQPTTRTFTYRLREGAAAVAPVVYQWSFEGATADDRLQNTGTGANATLQAVAYGSEGSTAKIGYGMGLDETTTAMSPQRIGRFSSTAGGALLATTGTVAIPTAFTVEALIRPDLMETGGAIGYAVMAGGASTNNRGYFVVSQEGATSDSTATIIGDSISQADNVGRTLTAFVPGHWYYVANTFIVSGSQTTINSYVANLTLGEASVTQTVAAQVASGRPLTAAQMAIGGYFAAGTAQEAWSGSIDEVSMFGRVLTAAEVQTRLDSLYQAPVQVAWSSAASGTATGGSGTWNSSGLRWVDGTGRMSTVPTAQLVFGGSAGTVTVSGSQTVASGLTFSADGYTLVGGTVALTGDQAANTVTVGGGATATLATMLSATGGMTKSGAGTLVLANTSLVSAPYRITAGQLKLGVANALGGTAAVVLAPTSGLATLDLNGFSHGLASLSTSGSGGIAVIDTTASSGVATLTVGSGNLTETFAGRLQNSVAGGSLAFSKVGTGTMTLSGSDSAIGGTFAVNGGRVVINPGVAGRFSASGKLQLAAGSGATAALEILSGSNALSSTGIGAIGDGSGVSTLDVKGGMTTLAMSSARMLVGNKGTGAINVSGGSLTLSGSNDLFIGGDTSFAANNALGTITVSGGTLSITGSGALRMGVNVTGTTTGARGTVNLDGGVFETARSFSVGTGSGTMNFNGGTLRALASSANFIAVTTARVGPGGAVLDTGANTVSIAQPLVTSGSGSGGLTKLGAGTLRLTAANTYTGPTQISAGTLAVFGNQSAATGAVTVAGGATLAGTGVVGGNTTIQAGATLAPGASPGTLTFTQGLTWASGGNYNWQVLDAGGSAGTAEGWDLASVAGTLAVASTSADPFRINLWSLSGISPDVSGSAANFDPSRSATWRIANATGGITGFSADKFRITTGAANGTGGFANDTARGTFSLALSGSTGIDLVFTPVTTLTWHGDGVNPGGSGAWTTSGTNWFNGQDMGRWVPQAKAVFSGTAGTVTVAGDVMVGAGMQFTTPGYALNVASGTLVLASGSVSGSPALVVSTGGLVSLPADRREIVNLSALAVDQATGGKLDIGAGRITVAPGGITEADLRADLIAGRGAGSFSGTSGIMTTGPKASAGSTNPAVGYRVLASGTAIVAWAASGDANLDGVVNSSDAMLIHAAQLYGKGNVGATWSQGDFNYSGGVNALDIQSMLSAQLYGKGSYLPVAQGGMLAMALAGGGMGDGLLLNDASLDSGSLQGFVAVPEPGGLMLAGMGIVAAWLSCRRRVREGGCRRWACRGRLLRLFGKPSLPAPSRVARAET